MRRAWWIGVLALWCSMPSSILAQWTEPPGSGWLNVALIHHDTRRTFDASGRVASLFNEDGRSITTSLYLTGVYGVVHGIDVWVQWPVHRLQFDDVVEQRRSVGSGDPRFHVRLGPTLFGWKPRPIALRSGVKLAVGDFPIDAEVVPLTEGQVDVETLLELGHTFGSQALYINGWIGYRWRFLNAAANRTPGDEWFVYANLGGAWRRVQWRIATEGLRGRAPLFDFSGLTLAVPSDRRRFWQIQPGLGWRLGSGVAEASVRIPLQGQNLPAGPAFMLSYFMRWAR